MTSSRNNSDISVILETVTCIPQQITNSPQGHLSHFTSFLHSPCTLKVSIAHKIPTTYPFYCIQQINFGTDSTSFIQQTNSPPTENIFRHLRMVNQLTKQSKYINYTFLNIRMAGWQAHDEDDVFFFNSASNFHTVIWPVASPVEKMPEPAGPIWIARTSRFANSLPLSANLKPISFP